MEHSFDIPEVAVLWILQFACSSNLELSIITSINRKWRGITSSFMEYMVEETLLLLKPPLSNSLTFLKTETETKKFSIEHFKMLLLPDMIMEILKRRLKLRSYKHLTPVNFNIKREDGNDYEIDEEMSYASHLVSKESEAFCLSWFHPKGIQIRTLDLSKNDEDDSSGCSDDVCGEDWPSIGQSTQSNTKSPWDKSSSELITVVDEWQSYLNAVDILFPLGYATSFVREALALASERSLDDFPLISPPAKRFFENNNCETHWRLSKARQSNFAVRGATFARPHGFCLCWADEVDKAKIGIETLVEPDVSSHEHRILGYKLKAIRRLEKKKIARMKLSLPRICLSTLAKNPDYQGHGLHGENIGIGKIKGRRQRCVQFLNANKERAVYMRTHPFDCGPIQSPVTMFLVGIATEDGCFVSGLKNRFELCHNYGSDSDELVELSPISLATDSTAAVASYRMNSISGHGSLASSIVDDNDYSSEGDSDEDRIGDLNCHCKIQHQQRFGACEDSSYDDDKTSNLETDNSRIVRGALGPGRWHMYTAIFDGSMSTLRVDGVDEPINVSEESKSKGNQTPSLDGLTIGSDHAFDMSLCFGEGSDGEGEGSIAELAVFKGAMAKEDIQCFETFLMKKHGILHGSTGFKRGPASQGSQQLSTKGKDGDQWSEDLFRRDVNLLMAHRPPYAAPSGRSIPLRFAARHRSVAWTRHCDVTGKPLRVSRIGSKLSNGSSDW